MTNRSVAGRPSAAHGQTRTLFTALGALVLLAPLGARADTRNDAKRHFHDGMAMIASGQVERGIAELKQAYAIKPHPDVLYDIAKAYVDLGNIPEALNYFRQYVATDPVDREQVLKVMGRLQAAIANTPGAPAPSQAALTGSGSTDVQRLLSQLQALLAQQQGSGAVGPPAPGGNAVPAVAGKPAAPAEEDMFEAATVTAATKASAKEIAKELNRSGHEIANEDDLFDEQVVTAGVRSSSEARTPASLTVISDEEIRLSGATTVPELLRRVPGVDVAEMNPSDTNISMRGFNRRMSNKVLVLVDGRPVYQDFLGATFWSLIDVSMNDIQRVEVIRGPGSALYGASAFSGVVNIITKIGDEASGARAYFNGGNHQTYQSGVSVGGRTGKLSYRTTVAYDRADKWTKDVADGRPDFSPQFAQTNRSREVQRADMSVRYDLGKYQVNAGAGYDQVAAEIVPLAALRTFFNQGNSGFARLEIGDSVTRLKAFYNGLRLTSGPEYWPNGIPTLTAPVRSDVIDAQAQTGFDFKAAGEHRVSIGAGYRYKTVDWTYLALANGSHRYEENHFDAFVQEEWAFNKSVSLILSLRVDRHPLLASQNVTTGGLIESPRGTLLYEFKPEQVLRFTVGSAFRAPTYLESYIDLLTGIPTQPGLGVRFTGDKSLRPEEMLQAEVGYRGRWGAFSPDLVVYGERVSNLIEEGGIVPPATPSQAIDPATGQYVVGYTGFQNSSAKFFGFGAEVGGKWAPADGLELNINYAYEKLLACQFGSCSGRTGSASPLTAVIANTANHKANFSALWRTKANLDLAADLHYVSSATWIERSFDSTQVGGIALTGYDIPAYTLINGRVAYRFIKDKLEAGVALYNVLGDAHREHPFGNQIGRRILFTATGAF